VHNYLAARDVTDLLTVRMASQKKVGRSSLLAYAFAKAAFDPASQAAPHLYTRREPWEQYQQRWCASESHHLFRFSRDDEFVIMRKAKQMLRLQRTQTFLA
jgi:hypothetical protein